MYMRAVTYRIVYVGIVSAGILLGLAFRHATVLAAPAPAFAQQPQASARLAPVATVTLATINVRTAARHPAAGAHAPAGGTAAARPSDAGTLEVSARVESSVPTLRLDMPYYSFGKLLPHVSKE